MAGGDSRFLLVALVFTLGVGVSAAEAPLYGLGSKEVVPNEFIILATDRFAVQESTSSRAAGSTSRFSQKLKERFSGLEVLREFRIGQTFLGVLVSTSVEELQKCRHDDDVGLMEANQKVFALGRAGFGDAGLDLSTTAGTVDTVCVNQSPARDAWGLTRMNQRSRPSFFTNAYSYSEDDDGEDVDVYVVDSGVHQDHNEFGGRAAWGMTVQNLMAEGNADLNGHGTHVASIAAGRLVGVAKKAKVISVKVLDRNGRGNLDAAIEAMQWISDRFNAERAQTGVKPKAVVNLSLGSPSVLNILDKAIEAVINQGIHVVVAAGNEKMDACNSTPARVAKAITVGSTDSEDSMSSFSNYGSCVDLFAPGTEIMGASIYSNDVYKLVSGTSQASPHVAGALARYLSSFKGINAPSPSQAKQHILDTSSRGYIKMSSTAWLTSPNKLLYKSCGPEINGGAQMIHPLTASALIVSVALSATAWH